MKIKRKSGFTLAEMMLTVAIITVLLGVAFIAFMRQQRTMTRLEYDSIAKEIFVAAQNHLTSAESQGYLQLDSSKYGTQGHYSDANTDDKDAVWYVINGDSAPEVLNLMLPNYALDGAALAGSYIIRYQPSAGLVLDVFYSRPGQLSFLTVTGTTLGSGDYTYENLMASCRGDDKLSARNKYGNENAVIGWYGNESPVDRGERLAVPSFEIINAEQLLVKVNDPNSTLDFASLKLIVVGKTSKAEKYFPLVINHVSQANGREIGAQGSIYSLILDDITFKDAAGAMHFVDIMQNADSGIFVPGEDITVKVVAYSNTKLANIAMSDEKVTNSLFADPDSVLKNGSKVEDGKISVANIRHLENLDGTVSAFVPTAVTSDPIEAKQITDLTWTDFKSKTDKENTQIQYDSGSTEKECFYPVSPAYSLAYDGQNHSISDVEANFAGSSGLFGTLKENSKVENLKLIDFDITSTSGNAGTLVGTATGTTITNVVAYNSKTNDSKFDNNDTTTDKKPNVTATGSAGGLIGSMTGGKADKSAAALYVNSTGTAAGGLIGSAANGGTVTACYSGGHTISGKPDGAEPKYDGHADVYPVRYDPEHFNVTSSGGTAGGLIGTAGDTVISNSYSTCSASGKTAGGFVGTGGTVSNSYCTGLVSGTDSEGAFAASGTSADSSCRYFEIINERLDKDDSGNLKAGYKYLKAFGNDTDGEVRKIDDTAVSYEAFVGGASTWDPAETYNSTLEDYYGGEYNLKTVFQIPKTDKSVTARDEAELFVATHYGDWPAPEEFIFN